MAGVREERAPVHAYVEKNPGGNATNPRVDSGGVAETTKRPEKGL